MKRFLSVIISLAMVVSLAACGAQEPADAAVQDSQPTAEGNAQTEAETKELVYPFGVVNAPMDMGGGYSYKTLCYQDTSLETNGYVFIRDYTVTPAEDAEGMVDKTVTAGFVYNDTNAYNYGMMTRVSYANMDGDGSIDDNDNNEWTVEFEGEEYTLSILQDEFVAREWLANQTYLTFYKLSVRVPEGYDEFALFFHNAANYVAHCPDGENLAEGTTITDLLDSDSQWFIFADEPGTYYGKPVKLQPYQTDPADIIYKDLYSQNAPPPAPGTLLYELLPQPLEEAVEEQPSAQESDAEEVYEEVNEEVYEDVPADMEEMPYDAVYIEIEDWTVNEIDGNGGYQPINFFLGVYGWQEEMQTIYRSYSDTDGIIQEFTLPAMEHGSVTMDITGTDITADSVCFEFILIDNEGFEMSASMVDIPVVR